MTAKRRRWAAVALWGLVVLWLLSPPVAGSDGATAGELRMALSEQQASLEQLVAIVEGLERIAPQRDAVEALLGEGDGADRIRAALAAIEGQGSQPGAIAALTDHVGAAPPPRWEPSAGDVVYVQSAPARVLLRHRSGELLELAPGSAGTVGEDRVSLLSVTAGEGGRPLAIALAVNGRQVEIAVR